MLTPCIKNAYNIAMKPALQNNRGFAHVLLIIVVILVLLTSVSAVLFYLRIPPFVLNSNVWGNAGVVPIIKSPEYATNFDLPDQTPPFVSISSVITNDNRRDVAKQIPFGVYNDDPKYTFRVEADTARNIYFKFKGSNVFDKKTRKTKEISLPDGAKDWTGVSQIDNDRLIISIADENGDNKNFVYNEVDGKFTEFVMPDDRCTIYCGGVRAKFKLSNDEVFVMRGMGDACWGHIFLYTLNLNTFKVTSYKDYESGCKGDVTSDEYVGTYKSSVITSESTYNTQEYSSIFTTLNDIDVKSGKSTVLLDREKMPKEIHTADLRGNLVYLYTTNQFSSTESLFEGYVYNLDSRQLSAKTKIPWFGFEEDPINSLIVETATFPDAKIVDFKLEEKFNPDTANMDDLIVAIFTTGTEVPWFTGSRFQQLIISEGTPTDNKTKLPYDCYKYVYRNIDNVSYDAGKMSVQLTFTSNHEKISEMDKQCIDVTLPLVYKVSFAVK